jgi:hypothetical protein
MTVRNFVDTLHLQLLVAYNHVNEVQPGGHVATTRPSQWQDEFTEADLPGLMQRVGDISADLLGVARIPVTPADPGTQWWHKIWGR